MKLFSNPQNATLIMVIIGLVLSVITLIIVLSEKPKIKSAVQKLINKSDEDEETSEVLLEEKDLSKEEIGKTNIL